MADEEAQLLRDAAKLPLEERVVHKNWKARKDAYEHMLRELRSARSQVEAEYCHLAPKIVSDANQGAQDVGCDVVLELLSDRLGGGVVDAERLCRCLVSKALNSRPGIVRKACDISLALVDHGCAEDVISAFSEAFTHKVPKVALAALDVVLQAIQAFGAKVVPAKQVMKAVPSVFDAKDAKVRAKGKEIVLELAKWIGPGAVRATVMEKMRDAQKAEVEGWLAEQTEIRPVPERFTYAERAQQEAAAAVAESDAAAIGEGHEQPAAGDAAPRQPVKDTSSSGERDVYELVDAVDVLAMIPKTFWKEVEDSKWSIRRDALDALQRVLRVPKAEPGSYHDVVGVLKRVIGKDSNAACVAKACACVTAACACLRKHFAPFVKGVFLSLCLDKLKDKNAAVHSASVDALEAMHHYCVSLADVMDTLAAALASPVPKMRQSLLRWLAQSVDREAAPEVAKTHGVLLVGIAKLASDADPQTRDAALSTVAAFARKAGSVSAISKHTNELDTRRQRQLEDLVGSTKGATAPDAVPQAGPAVRQATSRAAAAPASASVATASKRAPASRARTAQGPARPAKATQDGRSEVAEKVAPVTALNMDEARACLEDVFCATLVERLADKAWKVRCEAMDEALADMESLDWTAADPRLVHALCLHPGWKDTNFQVLCKLCAACTLAADRSPSFSKADAASVISAAIDKVADAKVKRPAGEMVLKMAEVVGVSFVESQVHAKASTHKNPKVYVEGLLLITRAAEEFGLAKAGPKLLVPWCTAALGHTVATVRQAGVELSTLLHRSMGQSLDAVLAAAVKPAMMDVVRDAWGKASGEGPAAPVRHVRGARAGAAHGAAAGAAALGASHLEAGGGGECAPGAAGAGAAADADDEEEELLPRVDIARDLAPALEQLAGESWKDRKAGVEAVEAAVQRAGRIEPTVGALFVALKPLMGDSNRNLAAQAVRLVALLAGALGTAFAGQAQPLMVSLVKNLNDGKPVVRAAVLDVIHAVSRTSGCAAVGDALLGALESPRCTSVAKAAAAEALTALIAVERAVRSVDDITIVLRVAAVALADKGIEPRRAASALLTAVAAHAAPSVVARAAGSLPAQARGPVQEQLCKLQPAASTGVASDSSAGRLPPPRSASASGQSRTAQGKGTPSRTLARPASALARTGGSSAGAKAGAAANGAAALDAAEGALLLKSTQDAKTARWLPQRSFRFEVRPTEAVDVQTALSPYLSASLAALFFSKDFQQHCKACDVLLPHVDAYVAEIVSVLDLLLRWAVLRFAEEKLQSLRKVQTLLLRVLQHLDAVGYQATDVEAAVFVPCLCEKVGHNQERARAGYIELLAAFQRLYNPHKLCVFFMEALASKNMKSRADCCEQMTLLLRAHGSTILYKGSRSKKTSGVPKLLAALTSERNSGVRQAALGTLMELHAEAGDGLWAMLGGDDLPRKQKECIQERIRAVQKQQGAQAKAAQAVGARAAVAAAPPLPPRPRDAASPAIHRPSSSPSPPSPEASPQVATIMAGALPRPQTANGASGGGAAAPPAAAPAGPSSLPRAEGNSVQDQYARLGEAGDGSRGQACAAQAADRRSPTPEYGPALGGGAATAPDAASGLPAGSTAPRAAQSSFPAPYEAVVVQRLGSVDSPVPQAMWDVKSDAARIREAMGDLQQKPGEPHIDSIKNMFFTFSALLDSRRPIEPEFTQMLRASADDLVRCLVGLLAPLMSLGKTLAIAGAPNPIRGVRYALNTVAKLCELDFCVYVERETLRWAVETLLRELSRANDVDKFKVPHAEVMRILNNVILKMLTHGAPNDVLAALLQLSSRTPRRPSAADDSAVFVELVSKCIVKACKMVPSWYNTMDVRVLLADLNEYMERVGSPDELAEPKAFQVVNAMLGALCLDHGPEMLRIAASMHLPTTRSEPLLLRTLRVRVTALRDCGQLPAAGPGGGPANAPSVASHHLASDGRAEPNGAASQPASLASSADMQTQPNGDGSVQSGATARPLQSRSSAINVSSAATGSPSTAVPERLYLDVQDILGHLADADKMKRGCELLYDFSVAHADEVTIADVLAPTSTKFKSVVHKQLTKVHSRRQKQLASGEEIASVHDEAAFAAQLRRLMTP